MHSEVTAFAEPSMNPSLMPIDGSDLEDFNPCIYTKLNWTPVSATDCKESKEMQDALNGAELNGYLRSFKTNQETKKQKMERDEDCAWSTCWSQN